MLQFSVWSKCNIYRSFMITITSEEAETLSAMEVYNCMLVILSVLVNRFSAQTTDTSTSLTASTNARTTGILDMGTVSIPSGVVTSPGYPNKYPPEVDRTVSLALPLHSTIEVYFDGLDTQECYDCNCDFVEMGFFGRFCGSKLPNHLITTNTQSRYLDVRFRSDDSDERTGFSLRYIIYPTTSKVPLQVPTSPACPYTPCNPACPLERQNHTTDYRGCSVCDCHWPATLNYQTTTPERVVGNSVLLHVLLNLRTEAEAMERQAKSLQEMAEMGMALTQPDKKMMWSN